MGIKIIEIIPALSPSVEYIVVLALELLRKRNSANRTVIDTSHQENAY